MKLRDHPGMNYGGAANWPPVWHRNGDEPLTGEIGVLANADTDRTGNRCFVTMEFESKRYIATVLFSDVTFCWLIARTLKNRVGTPIKDIGDLDLSYTL